MPASAPSLGRRGAAFGLLAAAVSGPGQTFFIGLFGASFRAMALALAVLAAGALLVAGADTALPLGGGLFLLRLGVQVLAGHFAMVVALLVPLLLRPLLRG